MSIILFEIIYLIYNYQTNRTFFTKKMLISLKMKLLGLGQQHISCPNEFIFLNLDKIDFYA